MPGRSVLVRRMKPLSRDSSACSRMNNIYEYGVYGKTVKHRLYASDKKERYFHLYHSIYKESAERGQSYEEIMNFLNVEETERETKE